MKKPELSNQNGTTTLLTSAIVLAAAIAACPAGTADAAPAPVPAGYKQSKFSGVNVRHVPKAAPVGQRGIMKDEKGKPRPFVKRPDGTIVMNRGIRLHNVRHAANPRNGIVADIDPDSLPYTLATTASSKTRTDTKKQPRSVVHPIR